MTQTFKQFFENATYPDRYSPINIGHNVAFKHADGTIGQGKVENVSTDMVSVNTKHGSLGIGPRQVTGRLANEENEENTDNDPYYLGYGFYERELYGKEHPTNPHPKGSNEHEDWRKRYHRGYEDRSRERSE